MDAFCALLAICAGNSPVTDEFPSHRPVTRSFDVFFYLRLNKRLSKQWWGWLFETTSRPLWRHCDDASLAKPTRHALAVNIDMEDKPTLQTQISSCRPTCKNTSRDETWLLCENAIFK